MKLVFTSSYGFGSLMTYKHKSSLRFQLLPKSPIMRVPSLFVAISSQSMLKASIMAIPSYVPLHHSGLIIFPYSVIAKIRAESPESLCVQYTPGYFLLLANPEDSTM